MGTATWEKIRDAATSNRAWLPTSNHLKQMIKAEKHHLADPALAARLVGVDRERLLRGEAGPPVMPRDGTFLGALFESVRA